MAATSGSYVDLYWIPVGAGTTFQRGSLLLYEFVAAALGRRGRRTLVHAGLTGSIEGRRFTMELMPAPRGPNVRGEVIGPVGARWAGRLRVFRYQVCVFEKDALPDQQWAVTPPVRMTEDANTVSRILELSRTVPAYVWGRRRPGHPEMWTSDSSASWILTKAGVDAEGIALPERCRAPGWSAGLVEAKGAGGAP